MTRQVEVILSPEAMDHLADLQAYYRRTIINAIEKHLTVGPTVPTQQRKPLRPNPFASWELRVGQFRVYYQVESENDNLIVYIVAVGRKVRNRIIIGREEAHL